MSISLFLHRPSFRIIVSLTIFLYIRHLRPILCSKNIGSIKIFGNDDSILKFDEKVALIVRPENLMPMIPDFQTRSSNSETILKFEQTS